MAHGFGNIHKILVIKFKHIGDVLLSVPAVKAIKSTFPEAKISYLLNAETAPMIEDLPAVDEVIPLHRQRGRLHELGILIVLRRKRFDLVVDLSGGGDRGVLYSFLTGARYRIGTLPAGRKGMWGKSKLYTHVAPVPDVRRHTVVRDLDIVRPFGITESDIKVDFVVPESARAVKNRYLHAAGLDADRPYAVVHPTSRWLFKCADDQVIAGVVDGLFELGLQVIVTCGPAAVELERLARILGFCQHRPVVFAGNLSLKELGAVLEKARIYVGVDSAPSHLAAALNVPAIVLFGPTGAYNWGPWTGEQGENPYPLEKGIQRAGKHVVIQQNWPCVPCGRAGCDSSRVSDCLIQLTSDQILSEASRILRCPHG